MSEISGYSRETENLTPYDYLFQIMSQYHEQKEYIPSKRRGPGRAKTAYTEKQRIFEDGLRYFAKTGEINMKIDLGGIGTKRFGVNRGTHPSQTSILTVPVLFLRIPSMIPPRLTRDEKIQALRNGRYIPDESSIYDFFSFIYPDGDVPAISEFFSQDLLDTRLSGLLGGLTIENNVVELFLQLARIQAESKTNEFIKVEENKSRTKEQKQEKVQKDIFGVKVKSRKPGSRTKEPKPKRSPKTSYGSSKVQQSKFDFEGTGFGRTTGIQGKRTSPNKSPPKRTSPNKSPSKQQNLVQENVYEEEEPEYSRSENPNTGSPQQQNEESSETLQIENL